MPVRVKKELLVIVAIAEKVILFHVMPFVSNVQLEPIVNVDPVVVTVAPELVSVPV